MGWSSSTNAITSRPRRSSMPSSRSPRDQIPARRWLGLTATPYRRDQLDDLIALQMGLFATP